MKMKVLFIDNGSYEIRSIYNGRVLPKMQNIAFKMRTAETAASSASIISGDNVTAAADDTATSSSRTTWVVGDAAESLPFATLLRSRGKRPVGLGGVLVDAPLQARIWRRLLYGRDHAGLTSETDVDLVVTVQPGTPKESAVLWYTLCFVLFKFKSVTFVAPGWKEFLDSYSSGSTRRRAPSPDAAEENGLASKKATTKKGGAAAAAAAASTKSSSSSDDPFWVFSETSALILDIGFSGMRCIPIVNMIPRRAGYLRLDLGLVHVGHFLTRLVSFTQMNLLAQSLPDLLIHRGVLEHTLQVESEAGNGDLPVGESTALHQHLYGWERAFVRATSSVNDSAADKAASRSNKFFQGSYRRRIRARDVQDKHGGGDSSIDMTPRPPQQFSTVWYVLPTQDDETEEQQAVGGNSAAAAAAAADGGNGAAGKNKKKGGVFGNNTEAAGGRRKSKRITARDAEKQRIKFGHVAALVCDAHGETNDDDFHQAADISAQQQPRKIKENVNNEKHVSSSSSSSDDESDSSSSDYNSSSDDDDDDFDRFVDEDPEAPMLRLDHERFISAEILFQPRAVVGRIDLVSGRINAAFGSGTSVSSVILGSTLSGKIIKEKGGHLLAGKNDDGDDSSDSDADRPLTVRAQQLAAALAFVSNSNDCGFRPLAASAGGGCVSLLVESFQRFAPPHVAAHLRHIVVTGGGARIKGCNRHIEKEVRQNLGEELSKNVQHDDGDNGPHAAADAGFNALQRHLEDSLKVQACGAGGGGGGGGGGSADVANFLARCRVDRAATATATKTGSNPTSRDANEKFVDRVFAAMQAVLA